VTDRHVGCNPQTAGEQFIEHRATLVDGGGAQCPRPVAQRRVGVGEPAEVAGPRGLDDIVHNVTSGAELDGVGECGTAVECRRR
jgi:hypothetical protein